MCISESENRSKNLCILNSIEFQCIRNWLRKKKTNKTKYFTDIRNGKYPRIEKVAFLPFVSVFLGNYSKQILFCQSEIGKKNNQD